MTRAQRAITSPSTSRHRPKCLAEPQLCLLPLALRGPQELQPPYAALPRALSGSEDHHSTRRPMPRAADSQVWPLPWLRTYVARVLLLTAPGPRSARTRNGPTARFHLLCRPSLPQLPAATPVALERGLGPHRLSAQLLPSGRQTPRRAPSSTHGASLRPPDAGGASPKGAWGCIVA
ncbi:hypothetical protein NDU88_007861 [Pleurodeles waltl]|uniref:Uncharacterized protein n=1 Tax=Pleurodeles waltl TaxID=8319 RepID=A0AAV7NU97_PLEWA|nr:hypothetical protein NDU88_007861 [Pleurodeles waltl]